MGLFNSKNKKEMETKREKFVKLSELRVNKIIDTLRLLGNCANAYLYEYNEEDIDKIFSVIENEIEICKKRFNNNKTQRFKLQ